MAQARASRQSKRDSVEVKALRAATLLDNPDLRAVFDDVRKQKIADIERLKLDGSEASERKALELIRELQAILEVKRFILRPLVAETLKKANETRA